MDISTETTIVTQRRFTVIFDNEQEARDVLVDPAPFQKALRHQLGKGHKPNWNTGLGKPAKAEKKTSGTRCPKCHKIFKRLGRHVASCDGMNDDDPLKLPANYKPSRNE